jgi:tRNA nucleotidyltransferase (CCA-adding enzyme)
MKNYLITTEFKIGDVTNTITSLGQSTMSALACQAEVAMNSGSFDSDTYGRPCFDIDGFITYPSEIKEINESTFNMLKPFIESYPLEQSEENLDGDVSSFVSYQSEENLDDEFRLSASM